MKAILALIVLAAAADFLQAAVEIHHEAYLHYLEAEHETMMKQFNDPISFDNSSGGAEPSRGPRPSRFPRPSGFPRPSRFPRPSGFPDIPAAIKPCVRFAVACHHKADDDACLHLCCIYATGKCIKKQVHIDPAHIPPKVKFCGKLTQLCMKHSPSCEEKLCCVVRFAECVGLLGERA